MKPPAEQLEWSSSDGWLLMALFLAQGVTGATLYELIGAADVTNHAIPTSEELSLSLTKFARCGLVTVAGGRYLISPSHLPAIQNAYEGRGGLSFASEKGVKWLRRSGLVMENRKRINFSDAHVKAAFDQYASALRSK
jgi:hypothetical protein